MGWLGDEFGGKLQPPTKSLVALLKVSTGAAGPAGLAMSPCRCLGNGWKRNDASMIFPGSLIITF